MAEAARDGDFRRFAGEFADPEIFAGLVNSIGYESVFKEDERVSFVNEAIEQLYFQLRKDPGRVVARPFGYVARTAYLLAQKTKRKNSSHVTLEPWHFKPPLTSSQEEDEAQDGAEREAEVRRRVDRLFAAVFSLIDDLGQENVVAVMKFIFEALRQAWARGDEDPPDLSNEEIADALGLETEAVRKLKSRGWLRLRERAKDAGIRFDRRTDMAVRDGEEKQPGERSS